GVGRRGAAGGGGFAPAPSDEGLSSVGGALTDARDEEGAFAKLVARATGNRLVDGQVVLGSDREAVLAEREGPSGHSAVVLASGGLGLISLPERDHRWPMPGIGWLRP